jgi:alpha-tubulin suppressor-like RCC1 family protein
MLLPMKPAHTSRRLALPVVATLVASAALAVVAAPAALAATTPRPAPSPIAAGFNHTLALASDGTVRAFGSGGNGDLGVGSHAEHDTPVQVKGVGGTGVLSHVAAVAAGSNYSLALLATGNVVAWGYNVNGSLGDHSNVERTLPVYVKSPTNIKLSGVVAIAASPIGTTSLALKSNGTVWAWGSNNQGQLGNNDGFHQDTNTPVQVTGPGGSGFLTGVVAIAVGAEHSVALKSNGSVWTWGGNGAGQLGNGTDGPSGQDAPVQVHNIDNVGMLSQVVGVSAGGYFTIALRSDGTMVGWGDDNYGQLGDNAPGSHSDLPVAPVGLGGRLVAIAAGYINTYALKQDGTVWAWGDDFNGAIGDGTNSSTPVATPVRVNRLVDGSGVVSLAGGFGRGEAVTSPGVVYGWGYNASGQLGDSTTINATSPVRTVTVPKIANPALRVLVAPKISGTAAAGHTLSVSKGTWGLPATSWAYQWLRNGAAILHATHATYTLTTADKGKRISVRVTASRSGYPSGHTTTAARTVSS